MADLITSLRLMLRNPIRMNGAAIRALRKAFSLILDDIARGLGRW